MKAKTVKIGKVTIGKSKPLVLIAGPCVIESEKQALMHAEAIKRIAEKVGMPFIFKSSYDKANRSSVNSFRGPGLVKGLKILKRIKEKVGVPVISDVHCRSELAKAKKVLDVIQIPAFLCRQTDLLVAAAKTKKPINIKKGQFLAPHDITNAIEKVTRSGNNKIIITERGTSFGYNNLVSDMRSLQIMRGFGYPVIYDATHSVQLPGGLGKASGGQKQFICGLAKAAAAMGCDGIFIEVHKNPSKAPCDGPNMLALNKLQGLLEKIVEIDEITKEE